MKTPHEYKNMEYGKVILSLMMLSESKRYCEIGVKKAFTFNKVTPCVDYAIGVDIIDSKPFINSKMSNYEFHQCESTDFAKKYNGEKFDFIFIDADHSKESVLIDVDMMKGHLKPYSGLMFLHDTYPIKKELCKEGYCHDAWKAAKQIKLFKRELEIVTIPFPWAGLSILRYCPDDFHGTEFLLQEEFFQILLERKKME